MKVVIDRFEGNYAVCEQEDGEMMNIERGKIPSEAREGDVLQINGDDIVIDKEETMRRKKEIEQLVEDLWD